MCSVVHCKDLSASALEEAKEMWEKHGHPFPATFQELDPCTVKNSSKVPSLRISPSLAIEIFSLCYAKLCLVRSDFSSKAVI